MLENTASSIVVSDKIDEAPLKPRNSMTMLRSTNKAFSEQSPRFELQDGRIRKPGDAGRHSRRALHLPFPLGNHETPGAALQRWL
jgi:hypothetical protein